MKKFNEKKTIKTLQEAEVNIRVREVYRKHQITEQIFIAGGTNSGARHVPKYLTYNTIRNRLANKKIRKPTNRNWNKKLT